MKSLIKERRVKEFYTRSISDVLNEFDVSPNGLTLSQVEERKKELPKDEVYKKSNIVSKFFEQFFDLMIIILLVSSFISILIGIIENTSEEIIDGVLILIIVLMNAIFGVVQQYKAEKSLEALGKLIMPKTIVIRQGKAVKISTSDLVLGDIVVLEAGGIVPADLRLIESVQLKIDESSLTGESHAVIKDCQKVLDSDTLLGERVNMAYKGTTVSFGKGKGVVSAISNQTEFGKIANALKDSAKEQTPLQKSIKDVGKVLTYLVLIIAVITFVMEICIDPHNIMEAFLTAVAIAVAAIPESMPAVITIIMSLGVSRLAKQKAIVRQMHSVETLGCCDVICSDKTGTITQNKMTVKGCYYDDKVQCTEFNKSMAFAKLNRACFYCNDAVEGEKGLIGDPTEIALMNFAKKFNKSQFTKLNELPFDSGRKLMSVLVDENGKTMYTKGAPDIILEKCDRVLKDGKILPLDNASKKKILSGNEKMSGKAMRVLGFAFKPNCGDRDFYEDGLIFIGLVGMIDPPRPEIEEAVQKCKEAGMKPVMITGDYSQTAFAIASEIGIASSMKQVLSGQELKKMSEEKLAKVIDQFTVFARVSPEDKVRIVEAFKKRGHVVAMTGDGVNDAPSIKKANIGIGMGISGTDVAKQASDLIITDDNFATIVIAVEEGRKIYENIQKTVKFLFSANMAELFSLFIVTLIYPQFVFLLPVQILFVNLITDSLPAIALGLENPEKDLMKLPPRSSKKSLFANGIGVSIIVLGLVQTALVVLSYVLGICLYDDKIAMTMGFYTLNIIQMFYLASMRTNVNIFKSKPHKNIFFLLAVGFCFLIVIILAFTPCGALLQLEKLNLSQWLIIFGLSMAMLVISEIYKFIAKRVMKRITKKIK